MTTAGTRLDTLPRNLPALCTPEPSIWQVSGQQEGLCRVDSELEQPRALQGVVGMGLIAAPLTQLTAPPFLPDGLHNTPDLWSSPGAMSQSSYGAMLGSSSSPLPQSASFNSLHQHERMVTSQHILSCPP